MNRKITLTLLSLYLSLTLYAQQPQKYIFFLHNKFLESHSLTEAHPKYGIAEYETILRKLEGKNIILISEKRKPDTDPKAYAMGVKQQIDSLMKMGVPADNICVIGTSQGGYIAQYVSYYEQNTQLKFVFIGSSFKDDSVDKDPHFKLYGKILSITESSDEGHVALSKEQRFIRSGITDFKEIELHTGLNHGFLFKALDAWVVPAKQWAIKK